MNEYGERLAHRLFLLKKDTKELAEEAKNRGYEISLSTVYNAANGRNDPTEQNKRIYDEILKDWEKEKEEGR